MFTGRWPVEREHTLIQLWNEGKLSASQIAKHLGGFEHLKDGGRSAILGKVHRLGLAPRTAGFTPEEIAQRRQANLEASRRRDRDRSARARQEREAAEVAKLVAIKQSEEDRKKASVPFNDLRPFSRHLSNQCRFVLNDAAPFIACGAVTMPGESWCPHCREIVMAKPAPVLSDAERFRRAVAFKKNALPRTVTDMPTARDRAA